MPRRGRLGNDPGSDVHLTPPEIWQRVGQVADGPVLDPCPHPFVKDTLGDPWEPSHLAYVNPPFTALEAFSRKAVETMERGYSVIVLVPCRSSQPFWSVLCDAASHVAFWDGNADYTRKKDPGYLPRRIRFLRPDGTRQAGAPFDAALFLLSYQKPIRVRFEYAFVDVATIARLGGR